LPYDYPGGLKGCNGERPVSKAHEGRPENKGGVMAEEGKTISRKKKKLGKRVVLQRTKPLHDYEGLYAVAHKIACWEAEG